MKIRCNCKDAKIQARTLETALLELGYNSEIVATALNGEFVPRHLRHQTPLNAGDELDVLAPMQGG